MSAVPPQSVQFGCPHCGCKLTIPAQSGPIQGPCPRCQKQIRAAAPAAPPAPSPVGKPASSIHGVTNAFHADTTIAKAPIPLTPAPQPQSQTLHCQCPSCEHHHAFEASQLGEVARCSGCQTAIRLPQKPQPEVPLQPQPVTPKHVPDERQAVVKSETVAPAQSALDSVVKTLHEYEQAGVPADHPDRLHLLEQFFAAVSGGGKNLAQNDQALGSSIESALPNKTEFQSGTVRSHLPPRRDGFTPEIRPRTVPPIGRTARPAVGLQAGQPSVARNDPAANFRPLRAPSPGETGLSRIEDLRQKAPPMESSGPLRRRRQGSTRLLAREHQERSSVSPLKKAALGFIVLAGALGIAYVANDLYQTKKQQAVEFEPASMSRENLPAPPPLTMAEQYEIKDLVRAFHQAGTPEAKAALVADGLGMLASMRSFYAVHGVESADLSIDPYLTHVEQGDTDYFRGTGAYNDGRTMEFYVKRQGDEFVLDWPSLSGYSAMSWATFLTEKPALPMEFRVVASKAPTALGEGAQEMALSLYSPTGEEKVIGYADATSLAGGELDRVFSQYGKSPVKLTLKLAYEDYRGSDPRLMVTEVVRNDWLALASTM